MSSLHPVIDQIFDVIIDIAVPAGTCILYILKRKIYGSRLIQNDTLWAHRHYSGDRNPLLLTSGQFVR